jgi:hypothetical protein
MALVQCAECGHDISSEAAACPQCGKPGLVALKKKQDSKQAIGCAIMIIGTVAARALLGSVAGAATFLVGLALVVANTRLR